MTSQQTALAIGSIFVGVLCAYGAVDQLRKGETWGATGKGRVKRAEEPVYFWYMFVVRAVLGPILAVLGVFALK